MKKVLTVGRDPSCDIPIAHDSVSRKHAEIHLTVSARLFVVDCHSRNGTYVLEGSIARRINQEAVDPQCTLRFGEFDLPARDIAQRLGAPARFVRCRCGGVVAAGGTCRVCGEVVQG